MFVYKIIPTRRKILKNIYAKFFFRSISFPLPKLIPLQNAYWKYRLPGKSALRLSPTGDYASASFGM